MEHTGLLLDGSERRREAMLLGRLACEVASAMPGLCAELRKRSLAKLNLDLTGCSVRTKLCQRLPCLIGHRRVRTILRDPC